MAAPVAATKASACSIGVVTVIGGAAIIEGLQLLRLSKHLPHDWKEQRRFLGFAA